MTACFAVAGSSRFDLRGYDSCLNELHTCVGCALCLSVYPIGDVQESTNADLVLDFEKALNADFILSGEALSSLC